MPPAAAQSPARTPASSGRMTLTNVARGKITKPLRVLCYGVEGVGKTSFAAGAPSPIFCCSEDGTAQLDVPRFPEPETWGDVLDVVTTLRTQPHDYQTLVIDTLDWVEPLCWTFICARDGQQNIESYGYGKGYVAALEEWRILIKELERLRDVRGMGMVFLAHSWIKSFKDPESDGYDRYEMKLHKLAAGLLREWCDVCLFANYETLAHKDERTKRVRGVSSGARYLYTGRHAAYDAKNRYSLPARLPLSWQAFADAMAAGPADPALITQQIRDLLPDVPAEKHAAIEAAIQQKPTDAAHLAEVLNRVIATIRPKE